MARFLACTSPARGHLYPITPTLLELARRGHDVHVRTLASEARALTASGLDVAAIDRAIEEIELKDWQSTEPSEGIGQIFDAFARRAGYEIEDLRRSIADVRPDCLLVDITTAVRRRSPRPRVCRGHAGSRSWPTPRSTRRPRRASTSFPTRSCRAG